MFVTLLILVALSEARSVVGPRGLVDPILDCGLRNLTWYHASKGLTQSDASSLIFDALLLGSECNQSFSPIPPAPKHRSYLRPSASAATFYVSPTGSDSTGSGSESSPFATINKGLEASRSVPPPATIILRGGTYYLPAPIVLTSQDSYLTLAAYPGETPTLSGGSPLTGLTWTKYKDLPSLPITGPTVGTSCVSDIPGLLPRMNISGVVEYAGDMAAPEDCKAACLASSVCSSYTYHDSTCGTYALQCYFRVDGTYQPSSPWPGHYSGGKVPSINASVWAALIPTSYPTPFLNLFDGARNRRVTRARAPNGNPETTIDGFATGALAWAPPHAYPPPVDVKLATPTRADDPFFPNYQMGEGGTCAQFEPSSGFWCSTNPPAGAQFNVPSGVTLPPGLLFPTDWEGSVDGAVFHAFHGARWGDWKFAVDTLNASSGELTWTWGGFQEARGWAKGDTFMLEGLLALLDSNDEWFFEPATSTLYVSFNNTGSDGTPAPPPSPSTSFITTRLDSLIRITGTPDTPAVGIQLSGLTLSHTAPTFMKSYAMPSGGDWSVRLDGGVWVEGSEGVTMEGCNFTNLGGNALVLYGYNRNATVAHSSFRWVGDSAVVSVGKVEGIDGSALEVPLGSVVEGNIASEFGLYTKQSGFYYHALSGAARVEGNVFFNMPRAGININDGYYGANAVVGNTAFNCVRETSDQ